MNKFDIEPILVADQALLQGHFLLRSGMHSSHYLQCAKILQHPEHCEAVANALARKLEGASVDVVLGPATGGIVIAYELARALGCRSIFAERVDDVFTLRRGFEILPGETVVIAEDVITTGGAAQEVVELVRKAGASCLAVTALVNRSGKNPFPVPFHYLYELDAPAWDASECPLCKQGKPVEKPGSRAEVRH